MNLGKNQKIEQVDKNSGILTVTMQYKFNISVRNEICLKKIRFVETISCTRSCFNYFTNTVSLE